MKKSLAFVVACSLLSRVPLKADQRFTLDLSPTVAFAPATIRVRTMLAPNPENRAIQIIAESPDFYRSSEILLDGERAPRATVVEFRSLPAGEYTVTAVLIRMRDRTTLSQYLRVVSTGIE